MTDNNLDSPIKLENDEPWWQRFPSPLAEEPVLSTAEGSAVEVLQNDNHALDSAIQLRNDKPITSLPGVTGQSSVFILQCF